MTDTTGALQLALRRQQLMSDADGFRVWQPETTTVSWPAAATALVLCDVWDHHWCRGAEARLEELLPRMERVVRALRERGVLIVHAPSETMAFYAGAPARERAQTAAPDAPPPNREHADPPLPVDASQGGCDAEGGLPHAVWSRQHPAITIDQERDLISDNGRELYACYTQRGIEHVLIMGVHTNMCILNRTFAVKQLVRWGIDVALIRDLTDAMYDPACAPYVSHAEGTRLVVEYIEKFWCPTVGSGELLEG